MTDQTPPDKSSPQPSPATPGASDFLLKHLPGWRWSTDANYRITWLGEEFRSATGISPDAFMGACVLDPARGASVQEPGFDKYTETLLARLPLRNQPVERHLSNKCKTLLLVNGEPAYDGQGRFLGYHCHSLNLTRALAMLDHDSSLVGDLHHRAAALESQLAQRNIELAQSNRVLTDVLDAMGEGLLVTSGTQRDDPNNRILFVNPAYLRLFDLKEADVYPGLPVRDLLAKLVARGDLPEAGAPAVRRNMRKGGRFVLELASSGRTLYSKTAMRPGGGYVLVHTDVSELEERNRMLEAAREQADIANRAKSDFLAAMSHEIRTPMNGIVGMTDLLADSPLSSEQRLYVDTVRSSAVALTRLISDILDFSKIEAGRVEIESAPFVMTEVIHDTAALIAPLAKAKGIGFRVSPDAAMQGHFEGDSARLRQIVINLAGNAVKFTPEGHVGICVTHDPQEHIVTIEVVDTGIGIPDDRQEEIFEPFAQIEGGLQRTFEGTGLGLAITRRLVVAMGGTISLSSATGEGTRVKVCLPMQRIEAVTPAPPEPDTTHVPPGLRILVAEDNRTNQIVVDKMLARLAARPDIVENGQQAVAAFDQGQFDLVLMDLSMPQMNGLDAARAIRAAEARAGAQPTPIIALTGNAFEQDRQDAFAAGMDDFLTKPLRVRELTACLARHAPRDGTPRAEAP